MNETCAACGVEGESEKAGTGVRSVARVGPGAVLDEVALCEWCLQRRSAKAWIRASPLGSRVLAALGRREDPVAGRYAYVTDDRDVRLMRLRTDWMHRHAAAPSR
ncbi:MAG: hypothetical protein ACT4PT_10750 [Methanobacteriota archaeon]